MKTTPNTPNLFSTKWTKDSVWSKLETNDSQLIKALHKLYDFQTRTEQIARETKYFNGVGFNGTDGKFMSSLATFHTKFGYLSSKQVYCLRKRMRKYAGQLAKIANGELVVPAEPKTFRKNTRNSNASGSSNWSRPRVELPALTQNQVDYEVSSNYEPDEPVGLYEHCKQESGLSGQALTDYINRHYGHN